MLAFVLLASAGTAALSTNIAAGFSPVPAVINFENDRRRLGYISAKLIELDFDSRAAPRPTGTMVEGLYIPPAYPPPITFNGMDQSDVERAKASLESREENAEQVRNAAIRSRSGLAENILETAVGACFITLIALVIAFWAYPFQQWRRSWSHRPRKVSASIGIHGAAEKVGVVWGLFERVASPLRQAFVRGREKVRNQDPEG